MNSPEATAPLLDHARHPINEYIFGGEKPAEVVDLIAVFASAVSLRGLDGSKGAIPTIFSIEELAASKAAIPMSDGIGQYKRKEIQKDRNGCNVSVNVSSCGNEFETILKIIKGDTKVTYYSYSNADLYQEDRKISVAKRVKNEAGEDEWQTYDSVNIGQNKLIMNDIDSVSTFEDKDTFNNPYDEAIAGRIRNILVVSETLLADAVA